MHLFVFSWLCMENIVVSVRPVKWNGGGVPAIAPFTLNAKDWQSF
jgi:hypothetical protein